MAGTGFAPPGPAARRSLQVSRDVSRNNDKFTQAAGGWRRTIAALPAEPISPRPHGRHISRMIPFEGINRKV